MISAVANDTIQRPLPITNPYVVGLHVDEA